MIYMILYPESDNPRKVAKHVTVHLKADKKKLSYLFRQTKLLNVIVMLFSIISILPYSYEHIFKSYTILKPLLFLILME